MSPFSNPTILELLSKYRTVAAMYYSSALLGWDLEINMPEAGAEDRGKAQAELALLTQKMTLDLSGLVEKADQQKTLNDAEKGIVRVLKRELHYYRSVPPELLEELQRAISEAAIPWRQAREKSEFRIF